ncbi:ankyrin [Penicillium nucicola]|uniref:ankyrin n=1 Tax=Penicillium nucicola TaxID=1850975 RepID=UPI002544F049|nr:ankyrin [Penicillium nucicola]KAJ5751519.1 ankyrin [Penicillium nucicola]
MAVVQGITCAEDFALENYGEVIIAAANNGYGPLVTRFLEEEHNANPPGASHKLKVPSLAHAFSKALEIAIHCRYETVIKSLMEFKPDNDFYCQLVYTARPLDLAVGWRCHDPAIVKLLLELGVRPTDNSHLLTSSPLTQAVTAVAPSSQNLKILRLLINAGAELNPVNAVARFNPLLEAVRCRNIPAAALLEEYGADPLELEIEQILEVFSEPTQQSCEQEKWILGWIDVDKTIVSNWQNRWALFHGAIARGSIALMEKMIKRYGILGDYSRMPNESLHNWVENYLPHPLDVAAKYHQVEAAKVLLRYGAYPDGNIGRSGLPEGTPLFEAISAGCHDIVKLLLEHNASTNVVDQFYGSPLRAAILEGRPESARFLLDHGLQALFSLNDPPAQILFGAISAGPKTFNLLTELGLQLQPERKDHQSAFIKAAKPSWPSSIEPACFDVFVKAGFDVNIRYAGAPQAGCPLLVQAVLQVAHNYIDYRGKPSNTLLRRRIKELVNLLIRAGANIEDRDLETDRTPLLWIACEPRLPRREWAIELLLEKGANALFVNKHGLSPLREVVRGNDSHSARAILKSFDQKICLGYETIKSRIMAELQMKTHAEIQSNWPESIIQQAQVVLDDIKCIDAQVSDAAALATSEGVKKVISDWYWPRVYRS